MGAVDFRFTTGSLEQPRLVLEYLRARFSIRFHFYPTVDAKQADDLAEQKPLVPGRVQSARSTRALWRQAALACLLASLTSQRTLSVNCAPFATHCWMRSASSCRRTSLPEAIGL